MVDLIGAAGNFVLAYDKKDWNALKTLLHSEITYSEHATERNLEGPDAVVELCQVWGNAFPDSIGKIGRALGSGDHVTLELSWQGTHTGALPTPSGPIAPTGKKVHLPAAMVLTFEGERIRSVRHYFNLLTLLRQIGAA